MSELAEKLVNAFKKKKQKEQEKSPLDTIKEQVQNSAQRATYGGILSQSAYQKLVNAGIYPEFKSTHLSDNLKTLSHFALQKVLSGFMAYPRMMGAAEKINEKYSHNISVDEFKKLPIDEQLKLAANPANDVFATKYYGGIQVTEKPTLAYTKDLFKALGQAAINKKGSPYQDYTPIEYIKEYAPKLGQEVPAIKSYAENPPFKKLAAMVESGRLSKPAKLALEPLTAKWGWAIPPAAMAKTIEAISAMAANILKSPADVIGTAAMIYGDPMTQLSGGLGKGAKTALKASEDIMASGKKILPKGAEIGLSQAGRATINPLVEEATDDIMKYLTENTEKGLLDYSAIKNPIYSSALKTNIAKKISEPIIREVANKLPYEEAVKLFDFGGLKFMGETVIPGYKFNKIADIGKTLKTADLKDNAAKQFIAKLINRWQDAFVPSAKFPSDIYPHYQAIKSAEKVRVTEGAKLLQDLIKKNKIQKSDFPVIADYLGYSKDITDLNKEIEKLSSKTDLSNLLTSNEISSSKQKLLDIISERVNKLNEIKKLLPDIADKPNIQNFLKDYKSEFLDKFLYQTEKAFGIEYTPRDIYYPQRILKAPDEVLPNVKTLGRETAKFQLAQQTPYYKLKELENIGKIKMKGFLESNLTRTLEDSAALSRKELTNVVRSISSFTEKPGFSKTTIPELKGMYVPDEIIPQLEKVAKPFFGEESAAYIAGLYDKAIGLWKQLVLATPGYHFRNFYTDIVSGLFEWGTEFLNPQNWIDAIQLRAGKPVTFTDNFGNTVTKTLKDLKEAGTAGTAQTIVESLGAGGITNAKYNPFKYLTYAGGAREDLGRIVGYLIESKAGASDITAANVVKKVFFDYNELTPFEKNAMKRVLPFYTWLRRNSVRQLELLTKKTGRFATLSKIINYINTASNLTPEEKANLPDYFKTDAYIKTPLKTKEGLPLFLNPNIGFQDIARMFSSQDILSNVTPLARWLMEKPWSKSGEELFSGIPIHGKTDYTKDAPQYLQFLHKFDNSLLNKIGFTKDEKNVVKMSDVTAYWLKQIPLFYNTQRLFPNQVQIRTPYDWLSILGGIKLTPFDINKEKINKLYQLRDELNEAINTYNNLNPSKAIPSISEIKKLNELSAKQDFLKKLKAIRSKH